jgi:single-strand DNA-binding protein
LVKGDPLIVRGKLRTREWASEQGERRSTVELEATAIGPDLARCAATVRKQRWEERPRSTDDSPPVPSVEDLADLVDDRDSPDGLSLTDLADPARPLVPASA